jgi:hypothetical protein
MRDFTAAGLNFSLKLGLMENASSAAGIAAPRQGNGGRNVSGHLLTQHLTYYATENASHTHREVRARSASG